MNYAEVRKHLIAHDIKPSMQRVAIMKYLMDKKTHPTMDQIYNELLPEVPTLSKMTVYNSVNLFLEKKAVVSLNIDDRCIRYDACTDKHAHFKCRKCGKIYDIFWEDVNLPSFDSNPHLALEEAHVTFSGLCDKCKE